jgi:hypothetical protein
MNGHRTFPSFLLRKREERSEDRSHPVRNARGIATRARGELPFMAVPATPTHPSENRRSRDVLGLSQSATCSPQQETR